MSFTPPPGKPGSSGRGNQKPEHKGGKAKNSKQGSKHQDLTRSIRDMASEVHGLKDAKREHLEEIKEIKAKLEEEKEKLKKITANVENAESDKATIKRMIKKSAGRGFNFMTYADKSYATSSSRVVWFVHWDKYYLNFFVSLLAIYISGTMQLGSPAMEPLEVCYSTLNNGTFQVPLTNAEYYSVFDPPYQQMQNMILSGGQRILLKVDDIMDWPEFFIDLYGPLVHGSNFVSDIDQCDPNVEKHYNPHKIFSACGNFTTINFETGTEMPNYVNFKVFSGEIIDEASFYEYTVSDGTTIWLATEQEFERTATLLRNFNQHVTLMDMTMQNYVYTVIYYEPILVEAVFEYVDEICDVEWSPNEDLLRVNYLFRTYGYSPDFWRCYSDSKKITTTNWLLTFLVHIWAALLIPLSLSYEWRTRIMKHRPSFELVGRLKKTHPDMRIDNYRIGDYKHDPMYVTFEYTKIEPRTKSIRRTNTIYEFFFWLVKMWKIYILFEEFYLFHEYDRTNSTLTQLPTLIKQGRIKNKVKQNLEVVGFQTVTTPMVISLTAFTNICTPDKMHFDTPREVRKEQVKRAISRICTVNINSYLKFEGYGDILLNTQHVIMAYIDHMVGNALARDMSPFY